MKKLFCILISLILTAYSTYSAEYVYEICEKNYLLPENMEIYELARGHSIQSHCLIAYKKNIESFENRFYLYDYHGNYIAGPYNKIKYQFSKNGKEYYVAQRRDYYSPDDQVYIYYSNKPEEKSNAAGFEETDDGISMINCYLVDEEGNEIFTKEEPVSFEYFTYKSDVFVKKYKERDYYRFDIETMTVSDELSYFSRFERIESENGIIIYDKQTDDYIFDEYYSELEMFYYEGKYYFCLTHNGNGAIMTADGSSGKIVPKYLIDTELSSAHLSIIHVDPYPPFAFYNYVCPLYFECTDKEEDLIYFDIYGNKYTEEWHDKLLTFNSDDILMVLGDELPEGLRIEYSDGYVVEGNSNKFYSKKLLSHGKEIIPAHDGYMIYENDYYFVVSDYQSEGQSIYTLYDIEGNVVLDKQRCDNYYSFYGNKIYTSKQESLFTTEKSKIKEYTILNAPPKIYIDKEFVKTDTLPRIRNNITLVPIRAIAEKLGFEAAFKDGEIKITKDEKEIIFNIGSRKAVINGEEKEISTPPEIINDRTLVPIRAVAEAFGMEIEWNEGLRVVELMHNS